MENKPMNMTEARKLAKEKWGTLAFARITRYGGANHVVGKIEFYTDRNGKLQETNGYYGQGKTWEEAFARATSKGY